DLERRALIHSFEGHKGSVTSVAFHPDGRFLVSGSYDNTVKLWDLERRALIHSFEGHKASVNSVVFSPDGRFLASGSRDNTVKLWDLKRRALAHSFVGNKDSVTSVAFHPDGRFLASGSNDDTVKLWDLERRALVHSFEGHTSGVSSVAFSPDGHFLVSGSWDDTVKLWVPQKNGRLEGTLLGGNNGIWLSVDAQGKLWRGDDGSLLRTRADNGDWQPLPPQPLAQADTLEFKAVPDPVTLQPHQATDLEIKVTNTGARAAFWLRLEPALSADGAVRLDPPVNTPQFPARPWKHAVITRLEPAETGTFHAQISPNLPSPYWLPKPGPRKLTLTLVSAKGTRVTKTLTVDYQVPQLTLKLAQLESDRRTLKLQLNYVGGVDLPESRFRATLPGQNGSDLPWQTVRGLKTGGALELAFVLPENLKEDAFKKLRLTGETTGLPLLTWEQPVTDLKMASGYMLWLMPPLLLVLAATIFYLRRYRHPLVVKLSKQPGELLDLPPEQLAEARTRLSQTGREDSVLASAEVSRNTFEQAIAFFRELAPDEKARLLAQRLGGDVVKALSSGRGLGEGKPKDIDNIDSPHPNPLPQGEGNKRTLPEGGGSKVLNRLFELRLPDSFPLNLNRLLLFFPDAATDPLDVLTELKAVPEAARQHVTLVIGPDSEFQRKLWPKTNDRSNNYVSPPGPALSRLLLSPQADEVLAGILAEQLTLSQLSPYQVGGGVNRESVFFGRQAILAHIMNRDPANYLLVAGRQLGKSSLLKALERRYAERPQARCFYLSLSNEVLIPRLASLVGLDTATDLDRLVEFLESAQPAQTHHYLFLIDEADKFIAHERVRGYPILNGLRRLSEQGRCFFILAGFWELYEHAVLDYQSPLKNFAETIQIGALEEEACRQLATVPMHSMKLAYAAPALVDGIVKTTGQRANLIAICCHQILASLPHNQRTIEAYDVHRALHSEKTFNALRGWDQMTHDEAANRLDRIAVYATIGMETFSLEVLTRRLQEWGVQVDTQQLDRSVKRLELAFVLGREGDRYVYRVPLFKEMISKDEPAIRLEMELKI
ncbi:MAG: hypothetical protein L0Z62_45425, partial [Gemmataceae bacterium]|nr:hypothetical protein [Gemmataceae bacterium]